MQLIRNKITGNTIMHRLILCFIVSTFFPTILITLLLCLRFNRNYRITAESQIEISQNLIKANVDSFCKEIDNFTSAPYYHSYFSSRKSIDPNDKDYLTQLNKFQTEMQELVNLTAFSHSDIRDLLVFSDGQLLFFPIIYNEYSYFRNNLVLEDQSWYQHAREGEGKTVYTPARIETTDTDSVLDVSSFFVTRKIRNIRQSDQDNIIVLNLQSKRFENTLRNIDLLYDSFVVITNEKNELIYSSHPLTNNAVARIMNGQQFHYDGSLWTCYGSENEGGVLQVRIVYSLDEISRHTRSLIYSAAGIYLICIIIAMLLFYSFNTWIGNSTASLQTTFTKLEQGDLDARCPEVEVEEFNRIGTSINDVIEKLDEKIKNEYMLTIQQKSLQLSALQSQIQPHFLINTIYSFIALNQIGETKKLNNGFFSLAHLLRYVLKKKNITTIGEELSFLEDYLKLQQLRFGDRLSYEITCPDEYRSIQIPRLILQPLVENAVIHGIEPCEHPCFCRILIQERNSNLYILIEDNGVGFDKDEIENILTRNKDGSLTNHDGTVGLPFVKARLHISYPQAVFRLRCEQTTQVEIEIPWSELSNEPADS